MHADVHIRIGDEGMLQLARVLATNTTITKIDLYGEWGNACEGAPQGWAHAMQPLTERGSTTTLAMATLNDVLHGHVAHSQWVGRDSELLLLGPGVWLGTATSQGVGALMMGRPRMQHMAMHGTWHQGIARTSHAWCSVWRPGKHWAAPGTRPGCGSAQGQQGW